MGISNLKWHKAMGEAGTFFSHKEQKENLPTTLTPKQLAALQYPHVKGDMSQASEAAAAFKNWIENACLTGDLPHITTIENLPLGDVGYDEYLRQTIDNEFDKVTVRHIKASDFSTLLASEGEEPSVHLAAWIKATASESPVLSAEAADSSDGVEADKAGSMPLKAEAVPDGSLVVPVSAPAEGMEHVQTRRRTWRDVAWPHMVEMVKTGQYKTAKDFYKALESKAGTADSPFDRGTGQQRNVLFIREISETLALKTVQNYAWRELKASRKTG